jgi:hypothetical protein
MWKVCVIVFYSIFCNHKNSMCVSMKLFFCRRVCIFSTNLLFFIKGQTTKYCRRNILTWLSMQQLLNCIIYIINSKVSYILDYNHIILILLHKWISKNMWMKKTHWKRRTEYFVPQTEFELKKQYIIHFSPGRYINNKNRN